MKVNLREKKLKNGKRSLYLDFYPPIIADGKHTRREFLSLYVYEKAKSELEREHNKETRMLAETVRSKRQLDLQANPHSFISPRRKNADFLDFFRKVVAEKQNLSPSSQRRWKAVLNHLEDFSDSSCTFAQLDTRFVERFRDYLLSCESHKCTLLESKAALRRSANKPILAQNSAKEYFDRFVSAVKLAREQNYLGSDPTSKVKLIKLTTPKREFLLLEELRTLAQTSANIPDNLRRAALFSSLTGLRYSDIQNLTWVNVRRDSLDEATLHLKVKKTGEHLILPISDEACELLGTAGEASEKVLKGLKYDGRTNVYIERWTKAAGINKKVTFHSFRRTYATGLITGGVDLYTVSQMLGHSNVRQTQIYVNLVAEKKRAAAGKITLKL